jgi:cytochrome c biogenesis protein CcdA
MDLVPFKLPAISLKEKKTHPDVFSAILFGFAVGGLSSACNTCCNPFFPVVLAVSFVKGSVTWGFMMLTTFALGFGLPLAALITGISLGVGKISGTMTRVVMVAKYSGGIIMVILGFYLLITF